MECIEFKRLYLELDRMATLKNNDELTRDIESENELNSHLKKMYKASIENNCYWEHCSFNTYKITNGDRLKSYLLEYEDEDAQPIDFYKKELEWVDALISTNHGERFLDKLDPEREKFIFITESGLGLYFDILDYEILYKLQLAFEKKIIFLQEKISSLNAKPETAKELGNSNPDPHIEIDLIDTTGVEKIILLEKLGVLDFIKTKYPYLAVNNLASLISGFSGMNQRTVQSYLNPMYSDNAQQNNNPLNSVAKVKKIEAILKKIGISDY